MRAQTAARAIFQLGEVWDEVEALDNKVAADVLRPASGCTRGGSSSAARAGC